MNAGSARALVFACGTAMLLSAVMIAHLTKDGTRSTPEYRSVLRTLLAENPVQVSVSPNGRYVLEKIRGNPTLLFAFPTVREGWSPKKGQATHSSR